MDGTCKTTNKPCDGDETKCQLALNGYKPDDQPCFENYKCMFFKLLKPLKEPMYHIMCGGCQADAHDISLQALLRIIKEHVKRNHQYSKDNLIPVIKKLTPDGWVIVNKEGEEICNKKKQ